MPEGEPLIIGLTVTIGALPAVIFLVFAEKIVDYCGHSNILIFCFVNYICHHLSKYCHRQNNIDSFLDSDKRRLKWKPASINFINCSQNRHTSCLLQYSTGIKSSIEYCNKSLACRFYLKFIKWTWAQGS